MILRVKLNFPATAIFPGAEFGETPGAEVRSPLLDGGAVRAAWLF